MALIDKASLLFVPSVVAEGKAFNILPSGNRAPDSTDQNSGYDQTRADFDFDRGSNAAATRVNASGLIEKYRENVLTYSNDFSNAAWTKTRASFIGGQAGYDGSSNAWAFVDNTNNSTHLLYQTSLSLGAEVSTMSVYAKAGAVNFMAFRFEGSAVDYAYFDLANGTLGTIDSDYIEARITSVGNGWYRCEATRVLAASGNQAIILPAQTNNDPTYAGAGTTAIYIQDAQVEKGLVASSYLESTSVTGKAGVLVDLPRINYDANGQNASLLLEPSRANLIGYSEYFENYSQNRVAFLYNSTTSPEGLVNAAEFNDTATSGTHFVVLRSGVANGGVMSFFAKQNTHRYVQAGPSSSISKRVFFDLQDGVMATIGGSAESYYGIEDYGNGWYRCYVAFGNLESPSIFTAAGDGSSFNDNNYTGDGSGVYIYGAQVEQNVSYKTSYIPNHSGGTITRGADSCSVTGVSDVIGQTEGTLFVDFKFNGANSAVIYEISQTPLTPQNRIILFQPSDGVLQYVVLNNDSQQVNIASSSYLIGQRLKVAIAYKVNDFAFYINGVQIGTSNSGSVPSTSRVDVGNRQDGGFNADISVNQAILFNERLSNAELAALTA